MRQLVVEDSDAGSVALTLTSGQSTVAGVAHIPRLALLRTGVAEQLTVGSAGELANRARRYATTLAGSLESALVGDVRLADGGLRVEVRCGAAMQALVWESLRLLGGDSDPVHVFRSLPSPPAARGGSGECDLIWLAARKPGDVIPRYRVAGPVLAEMLLRRTIRPRWISTATTADVVRALPERVPSSPASVRIVHLDVHGGTRARPDEDGLLVTADFVAQFAGDLVDDKELERVLTAVGCTVFVSNACHSGDHRDLRRPPFAMRLLHLGLDAALVARGPVRESSGTQYHRYLYAALTSGASLLDAHAGAVAHGASAWRDDRDRTAQATVQPMLWVRSSGVAEEQLCSLEQDVGLEGVPMQDLLTQLVAAAQLQVMAEDGVLAAALAAAEEEVAAGRPMPMTVFTDRDLSAESAESMAATLRWAINAPPPPAGSAASSMLEVPALTFDERRALLRKLFRSESPLLDVLAVCVSGDPAHLAATATLAEADPVRALLRAGELGQMTGEMSPGREQGVAAARSVLVGFPDEPALRATLAVPLLAVDFGSELASAWIPPAPRVWLDYVQAADARMTMVQHGDYYFLRPDNSLRDAARALTPPSLLASFRTMEAWGGPEVTVRRAVWDAAAAHACATLLVLAVAARQVGVIDLNAVVQLLGLVANVSHRSASQLLNAMRVGLDGWSPVHPQVATAWDQLAGEWSDHNATGDPFFRIGEPAVAREERGSERERARRRAYLVARGDSVADALPVAVQMLMTASIADRFDYCESLHLLGEVQQRLGRPRLAVEMLLKERAVGPPADHRRLHNRDHLYEILVGIEPRDDDLLFTLAVEGAEIARAGGNRQLEGQFLTRALVCGLNAAQDEWLRRVIGDAEVNGHVSSHLLHLARGHLLLEDDPAAAVVELTVASASGGTYAAHAFLLLSAVDAANAEAHLRHGAATDNGRMYQTLCLDELLTRLIRARRISTLRTELNSLADVPLARPPYRYALAGVALLDRTPESGQRLVDAIVTDGGERLPLLLAIGVTASRIPLQAAVDAISRLLSWLHDPDSSPVPPSAAAANVARLARLLNTANQRWAINGLVSASEHAWNRDGHSALALAAELRSYACELLAELEDADGDDLAMLAWETGWLATLYRVQGRPTDAVETFERAIDLARDRLPPLSHAAIISRYGNLLHDLGENAAAVHLHWIAVRTALPYVELPATPSGEALAAALAAVDAVDKATPDFRRWAVMLVNLANTCTDHGDSPTARRIVYWMAQCVQAGHQFADEVMGLLVSVAQRLSTLGDGTTDVV